MNFHCLDWAHIGHEVPFDFSFHNSSWDLCFKPQSPVHELSSQNLRQYVGVAESFVWVVGLNSHELPNLHDPVLENVLHISFGLLLDALNESIESIDGVLYPWDVAEDLSNNCIIFL